jgi:hypothetical protein
MMPDGEVLITLTYPDRGSVEHTRVEMLFSLCDDDRKRHAPLLASHLGASYTVRRRAKMNLPRETDAIHARISDLYNTYPDIVDESLPAKNDSARGFLAGLRDYGEHLFHRLFVKSSVIQLPKEKHDAATLFALMKLRTEIKIVAVQTLPGSQHVFPFGVIYDPELHKTDILERFWAFRYQIEEQTEWSCNDGAFPTAPHIMATIDTGLDITDVHMRAEHPLHPLTPNVHRATTAADAVDRLSTCNDDCYYHYGHALVTATGVAPDNRLLWNGQEMSVADLEAADAPRYNRYPFLAFFNGCDTNANPAFDGDSILGRFSHADETGKLHCIATAHKIPPKLAAEFGHAFWRKFLCEQKTVGEALLQARREMVTSNQARSPLGLLYTLYGRSLLGLTRTNIPGWHIGASGDRSGTARHDESAKRT